MKHKAAATPPEPFTLWMGRLGNGTTVCNSAVEDEETRDFKHIAHINDAGIITWYVRSQGIPAEARAAIERDAAQEHAKWMDTWSKTPPVSQYQRILDWMSVGELVAYNQWLRGIPKPRDMARIVETIISDKMCRRASTVYGL